MPSPPTLRPNSWDPRAALEALFAPRPPPVPVPARSSTKIVVAAAREEEPRAAELQRRVARLLAAEGRAAVSRATRILLEHGFALPLDQEVQLKLLEHEDEARVRRAVEALTELLTTQPPKRRALLESRLKRIEEGAEEAPTRAMASSLLRKLALGAWRGRA
jgi:hypothetical protein